MLIFCLSLRLLFSKFKTFQLFMLISNCIYLQIIFFSSNTSISFSSITSLSHLNYQWWSRIKPDKRTNYCQRNLKKVDFFAVLGGCAASVGSFVIEASGQRIGHIYKGQAVEAENFLWQIHFNSLYLSQPQYGLREPVEYDRMPSTFYLIICC